MEEYTQSNEQIEAIKKVIQSQNQLSSNNSTYANEKKLLKWEKGQWKTWEDCPPFGQLIKHSIFVPLKVPLSSAYEIHLEKQDSLLTPSDCMEKILENSKNGTPIDIGLVIDATGDNLYSHDPKEWEDWDIEYVRLPISDSLVPSDAFVKEFFHCVGDFVHQKKENQHIAVFCRQGFNQTGFLIVSYLVEYGKLALDIAIQEFKNACPPGIYSHDYLEVLYKKYHSTMKNPQGRLNRPPPPEWDIESIKNNPIGSPGPGPEILTSLNKNVINNSFRQHLPSVPPVQHHEHDNNNYQISEPDSKRRKIRTWVDQVEPLPYGESIEKGSNEYIELIKKIEEITNIQDSFPGAEAIPLTGSHLKEKEDQKLPFLSSDYFVTWRAIGRRCLLLILQKGCYCISRDMSISRLDMKFPRKRNLKESIDDTLIDCVLVMDKYGDKKVPRFLAFDIITLEGEGVHKFRLEKRLQCLQNDVINPRKQDTTHDYQKEDYRIRMKDQFRIGKAETILNSFIKTVTHEAEGLIFTNKLSPYGLGGYQTDYPIFKFVGGSEAMASLDGSISDQHLFKFIAKIDTVIEK